MPQRHALITGGAGFIGSHLTDALLAQGFEVSVLDCLAPQVHGDAEMAEDGWPVYLDPRAHRIRGDILTDGVFEASLSSVTHLVHLAASVGVGQSMSQIVEYTRNNTLAAALMLDVLAKGGHTVERIAVASSMSIYGEGQYRLPNGAAAIGQLRDHDQLKAKRWELSQDGLTLTPEPTTEAKPLQPASIYAINKRDHEEMFLVMGRALNIPTIALRLFNAYGSRQALSNPYTGVAAIFISRLLNDQAPQIFEDGEQLRDFVHVHDVAEAFCTVLTSEQRLWQAFNVGSGQPITINAIANLLSQLLGKSIAPQVLGAYRVGDVRHCFGDISALERTFGFRPRRSFEAGMTELIEWVRTARLPVDKSAASMAELVGGGMVV